MLTQFPNGVASFGVPVVPGKDSGQVWGSTFFVDTATGSDSNTGLTPTEALATIEAAVGKCTTGKGDRIFVRDGAYAEAFTVSKSSVQIIGQSRSGVVITGDTDATDTIIVTGDEVTIRNVSVRAYDTGSDISLIKCTGDGLNVDNCDFLGGEYQVELSGSDGSIISASHFVTPSDVTDGACIIATDSNDCKITGCDFKIDSNTDAIIHHDADNLDVGYCSAVGDDDTGASASAFVLINGSDATSELMVHDCTATLFGAMIAENSTAVAAHGLGTGDIAVVASGSNAFNNNAYGCTLFFDTTGL